MSKLFSGKKKLLKPIISLNKSAENMTQNIDESIDIYSFNKNNNNKPFSLYNSNNNITIDYLNHYSPTNRSPISLPPISKKSKKFANSQKKNQIQNKLLPKNIIKNKDENNKIANKSNLNPLYIHSEGKIEEKKNNNLITIDINNINKRKDNFYSLLFNNRENNGSNIIKDKGLFLNRINKKKLNNIINFYSPGKNIISNNFANIDKNAENSPKILNENNSLNNNISNNSKNSIINEIIKEKVEKEKNKILNNISLPIINPEKLNSNNFNNNDFSHNNISKFKSFENNRNIITKEEKKEEDNKNINNDEHKNDNNNLNNEENKNDNRQIDYENNDNIDTTINFLKDLNTDKNNTFISFLCLIQTHLYIELLFDSLKINNNINTFRKKKQLNSLNNNQIAISSIKLSRLKELINIYFKILSNVYKKNIKNESIISIIYPIDAFFLYPIINNIFHKCLKIQICIFSIILITLSQLNEYEINLLIKNYLFNLIKQISFPLLLIYENFIKDEINLKYQEKISQYLNTDFNANFQKLFQEKKFYIKNDLYGKKSQLINQISKDLDKCIYSLQYYLSVNIKNSDIKIFGDCLNQMINAIDIKTLNQFVIIFLDTILYSELEENHKKVKNINETNNNIVNNNIKDYAPFLPNINPKYKYTLVLDMDETLVHFFFTKNIGMFFIRPYCFEFLNQLKDLYEIITFTAGTKEYADYILNLIDPDNEIIKYRLYRHHVTILGCSVYKDLNKLGRDLSKVIIIDNMKDNFKMQPNNGLYVKTWINDINDYQFKDLLKILKDIALLNVVDVRFIIEKINGKINKENNLINPYYNINIENILNETKR